MLIKYVMLVTHENYVPIIVKGVVGVASAGDFYVIALADSSVQHGAIAGRLRALGLHLGESLSQLDG